jgi:hypothetical protein
MHASDMIRIGRSLAGKLKRQLQQISTCTCGLLTWTAQGDCGVRANRAQGVHEHEAEEHDLSLVRQGRT